MSSLNLSTNGPSITRSYQSIVNSSLPSGPAASSPTYGQWAIYTVQAPLANAFQHDTGKESVLKLQTTGEGELADLIEEFSDGRIHFAFVKVKDPNTTLPKSVLVGWCGEGVPERTKGYFTSHLAAVSKVLHGYHVQVTARSDRDLTPESIIQKVADASGSKYSGGGNISSGGPPPPVASKPAFTPTRVGGGTSSFKPLGGRARPADVPENVDSDGWGADAPPVTRSQLEKVASAYKPTKVNIRELESQSQEPSRYTPPAPSNGKPDVVRGAYQPIGKPDIAEIRRQARESGSAKDDRPLPVKGAYEPTGPVDMAALRARPQKPDDTPTPQSEADDQPRPSLAERSSAFQQSERLTSLPKPKITKSFGASSFTGTKAPTPVGFTPKTNATAAPVGIASRTFAEEGGKTPAQIWAEKKGRQSGGGVISPNVTGGAPLPIRSQPSGDGGWKSGYTGKSWAPVHTTHTGKSASSNVSDTARSPQPEEPPSPAGGVSLMRDRFAAAPPPMDLSSKPSARGVAMPSLPSRPSATHDEDLPPIQPVSIPRPPPQPRTPEEEEEEHDLRPSSPIRVAMPVARSKAAEVEAPDERFGAPPLPADSLAQAARAARSVPAEPQVEAHDPARAASEAAAEATFGAGAAAAGAHAGQGGKTAIAQYDYEKAEDNELELRDGERVINIDMVDDDWWMGQNERGETGLFPSNYVELIEEEPAKAAQAPAGPAAQAAPAAPPAQAKGPTATAQYDYDAAEENELSFPDGATILNVEFPDDDWWFGEYNGKTGLFPANYVVLDN
ncbi:hypothetical protein EJ06DRAFT_533184 [Trichodelitschia bisporula]|uniref:Actin binding protein-like protein n=1 Tax=Trichodelitschia bisporula TaxID=703511 RepID=A0A6G1HND4_9PEZI|nr:hypothetical protein EJ06DRAFT_533184 [Trichodelitschia bisporula]